MATAQKTLYMDSVHYSQAATANVQFEIHIWSVIGCRLTKVKFGFFPATENVADLGARLTWL